MTTATKAPRQKLQNCPCCGAKPRYVHSGGVVTIVCPKNCIIVQGKVVSAVREEWNQRRFNQRTP